MIIINKAMLIIENNSFITEINASYGVDALPWWAILLIALGVLVVVIVIPWKKFYRYLTNKKENKKNVKLESKPLLNSDKTPIKNSKNTPYWGIYNWFGKKQALRLTKWVYVQEEEDPCELCRPFENKVLSLEEFVQDASTMAKAISRGYHHLGCHHLDIDYFHGTTKVPQNKWSKEHKQTRYNLRLKQYQVEQILRDLKYKLENKNLKPTSENKLRIEIQQKEEELVKFIKENNLIRNLERENPNISDWKKFN